MSFSWWKNLSISKKLFTVVGVMAMLIALELFTLIFAMNTLSAVRALVAGEAMWSKSQKMAVYYLYQYAITENNKFYLLYKEQLEVPLGDRKARIALENYPIDKQAVYDGFVQGKVHPDDIPAVVSLIERFYFISYMQKTIAVWKKGDASIDELMHLGEQLHQTIEKKKSSTQSTYRIDVSEIINKITVLDQQLTRDENEFSYVLGEASRWLERILLTLLLAAVFTIECTGLYLTFKFSKNISRAFTDISTAVKSIGEGQFGQRLEIRSQDELGQLAESINKMAHNLQKQIQERESAEHASQSKNLFLANMSHEMRTPLNAILGFSDILQDHSIAESDRSRYLAIIKRTGESLTTIINDVLDISKIEAEKVELNLSEFSLTQTLSDIFTFLKIRSDEKGIDLIIEKNGEVADYIFSDQTRLRQILINIIGNSIKFTDAGYVKLTYEVREDKIYFFVSDTGKGISHENRHHLFKPFSQGDNSIRKKYGGTGLGLTIAKKLSQLLGGDTGLLESTPGKGSVFFVNLSYKPVYKKQETLNFINSTQSINLTGKNILVVDDSLDNQILLEFYLLKQNAKVDFASNGEECVNQIQQKNYDLILMDMQMPIMDGYTATQKIRQMGLQTPIIAITGYAMKEDQQKCLDVGCNEFITKPLNKNKLFSALNKYCA
ncbi:MAG: response regulator [Pseudobdellovibrio sp.]